MREHEHYSSRMLEDAYLALSVSASISDMTKDGRDKGVTQTPEHQRCQDPHVPEVP